MRCLIGSLRAGWKSTNTAICLVSVVTSLMTLFLDDNTHSCSDSHPQRGGYIHPLGWYLRYRAEKSHPTAWVLGDKGLWWPTDDPEPGRSSK